MKRSNATTLQDIAREAGVTAMTVSVVLNGGRSGTRVSDATRARIEEVATRLRYRPNGVARGLSRRRLDTIGVVTVIDGNELNLYFLEVLNGILEEAARQGQNTTVFSISDWKDDEKRILQFCDGRVDGLILLAPSHISTDVADYILGHTPIVVIHGNSVQTHADDIEVDDEGGAYAVVRHLIECGHHRIAHLAASQDLLGARHRLAGYRRALAEAGIGCDESLVVPSGFSVQSGRNEMTRILDEGLISPLPTALFCASDAIASGCLEVLAAHGLRVPEDISVVGFDDMLLARMTTPPLTTVRQPLRRLGQFAVERLLFRISESAAPKPVFRLADASQLERSALTDPGSGAAGPIVLMPPAVSPPHTEVFPVELVIRGSVGPPPVRPDPEPIA